MQVIKSRSPRPVIKLASVKLEPFTSVIDFTTSMTVSEQQIEDLVKRPVGLSVGGERLCSSPEHRRLDTHTTTLPKT